MRFELTDAAAEFYKKELNVQNGEAVRLFVRGGEGFFLGVVKDQADQADYQVRRQDVTFFIKDSDEWFYEGKQLTYQETKDEVELQQI